MRKAHLPAGEPELADHGSHCHTKAGGWTAALWSGLFFSLALAFDAGTEAPPPVTGSPWTCTPLPGSAKGGGSKRAFEGQVHARLPGVQARQRLLGILGAPRRGSPLTEHPRPSSKGLGGGVLLRGSCGHWEQSRERGGDTGGPFPGVCCGGKASPEVTRGASFTLPGGQFPDPTTLRTAGRTLLASTRTTKTLGNGEPRPFPGQAAGLREAERVTQLGGDPGGGHAGLQGRRAEDQKSGHRELVYLWAACAPVPVSFSFSLRSQQSPFGKFQAGSAALRTERVSEAGV